MKNSETERCQNKVRNHLQLQFHLHWGSQSFSETTSEFLIVADDPLDQGKQKRKENNPYPP
jgi:hypothetical protein